MDCRLTAEGLPPFTGQFEVETIPIWGAVAVHNKLYAKYEVSLGYDLGGFLLRKLGISGFRLPC